MENLAYISVSSFCSLRQLVAVLKEIKSNPPKAASKSVAFSGYFNLKMVVCK